MRDKKLGDFAIIVLSVGILIAVFSIYGMVYQYRAAAMLRNSKIGPIKDVLADMEMNIAFSLSLLVILSLAGSMCALYIILYPPGGGKTPKLSREEIDELEREIDEIERGKREEQGTEM